MDIRSFIAALAAMALVTGCTPERDRAVAQASPAAIELTGRVVDAAELLDLAQEQDLTDRLATLEAATGHQLVAVTTPTLDGRHIEDYTRDLGNAWGIGRAGHDDGVILLVAPNERKVRIEVGRGLEATLTNEDCGKIIEEQILPHFKRGDMPGGVMAGSDALIAALS